MSQAASDLYQAVILDHNRAPRGYGDMSDATHRADGYNPICGDKVTVMLRMESGRLVRIGFTSQSCALCRASASVLVATATGMIQEQGATPETLQDLGMRFERTLSGKGGEIPGDAGAFEAIKNYPARAKCVMLPWRTMLSALRQGPGARNECVSTEAVSPEAGPGTAGRP